MVPTRFSHHPDAPLPRLRTLHAFLTAPRIPNSRRSSHTNSGTSHTKGKDHGTRQESSRPGDVASTEGKPSAVTAREAEAQRKKARTLAKQQQAAERIAAATGELASGIAEASLRAEELKRASDQIAAGAERPRARRRSR